MSDCFTPINRLRGVRRKPLALSRRQALIGGASLCALTLPQRVAADACDAFGALHARADFARGSERLWAQTEVPIIIDRLEREMARAELSLSGAVSLSNAAERAVFLEGLNIIGTGFLLFVGLGSAPMTLVGSVVFAGGLIVAKALAAPQSAGGLEIARDISLNRLGGILEVAGDDAYAASARSGIYSNAAGKFLGGLGLVFAAYEFRQASINSADLSAAERALRDKLSSLRQELNRMRSVAHAARVRAACLQALAEDAAAAQSMICPVSPP